MMRKILAAGVAAVIAVFMALMVFGGPQLQQSGGGGSQVSVIQGGNTAIVSAAGALKVDGSAATQPVSGTVTANQGGAPWSVTQSGTFTVQPGNTANTTAWLVKSIPNTSCTGTALVDSGIIVIPASSTLVTSFTVTSCVTKIFVTNTTSTAATFTVTDNAGTPNNYVVAFSVPGNSNMILDMSGIKFLSGVKWSQVTASALNGQIVGYQ
jgi:hypothetical protein